jgi:hypothetical protein
MDVLAGRTSSTPPVSVVDGGLPRRQAEYGRDERARRLALLRDSTIE